MDKVTSVLSSAVSLCLSATAPGAWCPDAVPRLQQHDMTHHSSNYGHFLWTNTRS